LNEFSLKEAIKGSDYVIHVASPFPAAQPKHENDIIKPAVDGTVAVIRGCHAA